MQPYIPSLLPPENIDWENLIPLIAQAHAELARYDGLLQSLINPSVLLSPLITQEAVLSSRIEGTQASLDDVLEAEAGLDKAKNESIKADIQEIVNYRNALILAENELELRHISLSFVKQIHKILLKSVRGENKQPGKFRDTQNWIGKPGSTIEQARFVPPPSYRVQDLMENWEQFLLENNFKDKLVQMAILHAQFEIIHPFNDGNGRIGRLLIPLFLYDKKLLHRPMFYMSEYLETHRNLYYDYLLGISENNQWQEWIEFFLKAIISQAEVNTVRAKKINALYEQLKPEFQKATHSQFAVSILDAFFHRPIVDASSILRLTKIKNRVTLNNILKKLTETGLIKLHKQGQGRRPNVYALPSLARIINTTSFR